MKHAIEILENEYQARKEAIATLTSIIDGWQSIHDQDALKVRKDKLKLHKDVIPEIETAIEILKSNTKRE